MVSSCDHNHQTIFNNVIYLFLLCCFQVITVLMKSSQREQNLCQSAPAELAEVCLFCGDEVSRQQYRR